MLSYFWSFGVFLQLLVFVVVMRKVKLFQIKDDAKHGFYVENLSEEYVTSYEDVTQILIKVSGEMVLKIRLCY